MTNMKSTKRALLSSVLALFLCFAMLIGTTYAWFTDSVTSANNIIKSGNLDIKLEYWNGDSWKDVEGSSDILAGDRWEPGYTDVAYLRIKNAGSLALKYQLGVNIVKEVAGVNVAGEKFLLSDYIYFDVVEGVDGETAGYATRQDAMKVATETTRISAGYSKAGTLIPKSDYVYLAMVVYMPAAVSNEANHNGTNVPSIDLGINIIATQLAYEEDGYGSDYDEDAIWADSYVTNQAELEAAITKGGLIALMNDIKITTVTVAKGESATINMNGYNLIGESTKDSGNQMGIKVNGDLTIIGDGLISMKHTGADMGWNALTAAISVEAGTLTLGKGVAVVHNGGSAMSYAVDVNSSGGATTLNVDGAILYSTYTAVRLFNNHQTAAATVNLNSGVIGGGSRGIWVQNPSAKAVDANGVVNIGAGYNYTVTVQDTSYNSRIYNFDTIFATTPAEAQEILDAAVPGSVIQLLPGVDFGALEIRANITLDGKTPVPGNANTEKVNYFANKYTNEFVRTIEDVTILGGPDAMVDAIVFKGNTHKIDGASGGTMYRFVEVKNLVIDGIEFTDASTYNVGTGFVSPLFIDLSHTRVDGLTVQNCKLDGDVSNMNFVYAYGTTTGGCDFTASLKNVSILNNTVSGIARLCELREAENVIISGNTVSNLIRELALLSNNAGNAYSGNIIVTENVADNIAIDYTSEKYNALFVRVGVGGDANIVVKDNVISNSNPISEVDFVKVTNHTGALTVENNTFN